MKRALRWDLLCKNITSAVRAFILASYVVLFLSAKQLLFFQPPPLLPRLPLFPTLSKNVCHHLSVFPHRSSVPFISFTRCTALIIQWLETDLDLAEPAEERSVTQSLMLSFTDDCILLTALLFSICLMETVHVLMQSLIVFQDPSSLLFQSKELWMCVRVFRVMKDVADH